MTGEPLRSPPFAYLDRWSVRAGEQLHLKASSAEDYHRTRRKTGPR